MRDVVPLVASTEVRLTRADGFSIVFRELAIVGDSVSGVEGPSGIRRAVAIDAIRTVEVRRLDVGTTLLVPAAWVALISLLQLARS